MIQVHRCDFNSRFLKVPKPMDFSIMIASPGTLSAGPLGMSKESDDATMIPNPLSADPPTPMELDDATAGPVTKSITTGAGRPKPMAFGTTIAIPDPLGAGPLGMSMESNDAIVIPNPLSTGLPTTPMEFDDATAGLVTQFITTSAGGSKPMDFGTTIAIPGPLSASPPEMPMESNDATSGPAQELVTTNAARSEITSQGDLAVHHLNPNALPIPASPTVSPHEPASVYPDPLPTSMNMDQETTIPPREPIRVMVHSSVHESNSW